MPPRKTGARDAEGVGVTICEMSGVKRLGLDAETRERRPTPREGFDELGHAEDRVHALGRHAYPQVLSQLVDTRHEPVRLEGSETTGSPEEDGVVSQGPGKARQHEIEYGASARRETP